MQLAASDGKDAAHIAEETIARVLQGRTQFLDGVSRGIAAAGRGEPVEDEEVLSWLEERERS